MYKLESAFGVVRFGNDTHMAYALGMASAAEENEVAALQLATADAVPVGVLSGSRAV